MSESFIVAFLFAFAVGALVAFVADQWRNRKPKFCDRCYHATALHLRDICMEPGCDCGVTDMYQRSALRGGR